jgi:7-cyano-7-deazaguanine synthase in queuosine biosynthesis
MVESILLISGGIDSLIAWFYLKKPWMLYCKLGHKYQAKELASLKGLGQAIPEFKEKLIFDNSLEIGSWEVGDKAYIPNRNLLLAICASNFSDRIYMGGIKGDDVEDKNPKAFKVMSKCLTKISKNRQIKILSPFWKMTKEQIIKWYLLQGYPAEWLNISISCYDKNYKGQCGECPSCFRKWIALESVGIKMESKKPMWKWPEINNYIIKMKNREYDIERTRTTFKVLRKYGYNL